MKEGYKTAAGTICPPDVWKVYICNLLDKKNARDTLKGIVLQNNHNPEAIKQLKEILKYRQDLLDFVDKIMVLV